MKQLGEEGEQGEVPADTGDGDSDGGNKVYEPINSYDELKARLTILQAQYNENVRGGNMDLVFFKGEPSFLFKFFLCYQINTYAY